MSNAKVPRAFLKWYLSTDLVLLTIHENPSYLIWFALIKKNDICYIEIFSKFLADSYTFS